MCAKLNSLFDSEIKVDFVTQVLKQVINIKATSPNYILEFRNTKPHLLQVYLNRNCQLKINSVKLLVIFLNHNLSPINELLVVRLKCICVVNNSFFVKPNRKLQIITILWIEAKFSHTKKTQRKQIGPLQYFRVFKNKHICLGKKTFGFKIRMERISQYIRKVLLCWTTCCWGWRVFEAKQTWILNGDRKFTWKI